jgi:uncharacterized protein YjiS (DUF1127 family)
MANLTYAAQTAVAGRSAGNALGRAIGALRAFGARLVEAVAAARRDHRMERSLRALDRRLLQDIGFDQGRC